MHCQVIKRCLCSALMGNSVYHLLQFRLYPPACDALWQAQARGIRPRMVKTTAMLVANGSLTSVEHLVASPELFVWVIQYGCIALDSMYEGRSRPNWAGLCIPKLSPHAVSWRHTLCRQYAPVQCGNVFSSILDWRSLTQCCMLLDIE